MIGMCFKLLSMTTDSATCDTEQFSFVEKYESVNGNYFKIDYRVNRFYMKLLIIPRSFRFHASFLSRFVQTITSRILSRKTKDDFLNLREHGSSRTKVTQISNTLHGVMVYFFTATTPYEFTISSL